MILRKIPQEDVSTSTAGSEKFGYSESDLLNNTYNANFVDLMVYETNRAQEYFNDATINLNLDDKASMFAARAMQHIYHKLLEKIINADYNVFKKNIKVNKIEKAGIALGVWAKYNLVY